MSIAVVGIVGAGTMGGGIATSLTQHGIAVRLFDNRPEAALKAAGQAEAFYARLVERQRMKPEAAKAATARIVPAATLADTAGADLVIEAVFEDFDLKARLLDELSLLVAPTTLVATNTSCLRVSDLAKHMRLPERFLGLHYFSPAAVNPIVEVVSGEATSPATIETALAFTRATGKQPLRCRDSYGFAINRFFCPYTNEAVRLLDEELGTAAEIDEVAKEALGVAAGPFQVMNLIKPRINLHAIGNLAPLGSFYAPAASMVAVGEADRAWEIGEAGDIEPGRRRRIADRLRLGAFLPVLQAIDEGVAEPADFDRGAREALKMGRPPCALMDALGRDAVEDLLRPAVAAYGIAMPRALQRVGSLVEA
ncbi:MAG TPA: 3-hydroxyacyl-CoA dehydrogenase family protein [Geminicoccaceae bacterium]|nr:3-hydroxyacyl-CoA dehydrogenase family protein [Geminicoccus sp.]HMU50980.1 3-hydroxyacyl-CoA dehydrogenase family protein [Geminicoccaceae bacterium]